MKKFIFAALFVLVSLTTAFAGSKEKELLFTSVTTGITFHVPANVKEVQDKIEAVILKTPDDEYVITAEAFDAASASEEEMTAHLAEMAKAAGMDIDKAESIENETKMIALNGLAVDFENGGAAVVGIVNVKDTELGYYVTVVASPKYVDYAVSSLLTIGFDPDAVK